MTLTLRTAIAHYGAQAKAKLHNVAVSGEPEDQLRAPLEGLIDDLGELCGFPQDAVEAVGESAIATLKTRPDYAITLRNALVGFIEIKAPGKGADPQVPWPRQGAMGETAIAAEPALHRRQPIQPSSQWPVGGDGRSSPGRYRDIGIRASGSARIARAIRQFLSVGAYPAYQREGTGKGRGPPLPIAPR